VNAEVNSEKYLRDLTYELRWRRLPEDQVADVVREVQSDLAESGADPEEVYGKARAYAATFPKGRSMSRGYRIATIGITVAVLLVLVRVVSSVVTEGSGNPLISILVLVGAFLLALLSAGVGAQIDRKLPAEAEA
jgi:hypothetical protein